MENLKQFDALIERYESITLEGIENCSVSFSISTKNQWGYNTAHVLTGFGSIDSCTLCMSILVKCSKCSWYTFTNSICDVDKNDVTYGNIVQSNTSKQLLQAFKKRAAHMRKVKKEYYENYK